MIAGFMLHALTVSALCALAAWLAERALAAFRRPRRLAWMFGMLLSVAIPLVALLPAGPQAAASSAVAAEVSHQDAAVPIYRLRAITLPAMPERPLLDDLLLFTWVAVTGSVLSIFAFTAVRLGRRSRGWARIDLARGSVLLANDLGPAVLGLLHPRIVFPRWLMSAPDTVQSMALEHELQHVAARDPLLLAAALAAVATLPWNLPLLWQLRRLRFALEVDCDARVLARGADAGDYGDALLVVSQRAISAPPGAVALIERPSQLERRINIMIATPRLSLFAVAVSLLAGASCLFAATKVEAPAPVSAAAPLKPMPSREASIKIGYKFGRLLETKYPGLLEAEHTDMPVILVLFNDAGEIEKSLRSESLPSPDAEIKLTREMFRPFGLDENLVPYMAINAVQSPNDPAKKVLMVYTERGAPGKLFVSHLFPDTRKIDREIYRHYFPEAVKQGSPPNHRAWVLFDAAGHGLRSGMETQPIAKNWDELLESRFSGIRTSGVTLTPVTDAAGDAIKDAAGADLQLVSVWLAPDSPLPAS
jgi:beta-lactamase regulating signal transducer with metallopeptidase domain